MRQDKRNRPGRWPSCANNENQLREDNERLRTRLEASQAEKSRGPPRPLPPSRPYKGKEVVVPDEIDLPADDELSSDSSRLPRRSPSPNAVEAQSRKGPFVDPIDPSVPRNAGYREKPARIDASQSQLMNMCLNDPRA